MFGLEDWIVLLATALAFSLVTNAINNFLGIRKRTKEIQAEMQKWQDEVKKATEKKDEKSLKRLNEKNEQMMGMMQEMMILPWKSMVFILPLFFLMIGDPWLTNFPGIIMQNFSSFVITLPFDLHVNAIFSFQFMNAGTYGPKGFFIVCVVFSGLFLSLIEQQMDKLKKT